MQYISAWLRAVGKHWKRELLAGALIGVLALFSEMSGVAVPPYIYLICAALLLFYAMFLAWMDERHEVERLTNELDQSKPTPVGKGLVEMLSTQAQRDQTDAMERLASELRAGRTHDRLQDTMQMMKESTLTHAKSQKAAELAALYNRGKQLYEMKLTENQHLEPWILNVKEWIGDVTASLNEIEAARFNALISHDDELRGHAEAIDGRHGDMKGRLLVYLERLETLMEHYEIPLVRVGF